MATIKDALRNPYVRIMRNGMLGRGVTLSSSEVVDLSCDDAIAQVAYNYLVELGLDEAQIKKVLRPKSAHDPQATK